MTPTIFAASAVIFVLLLWLIRRLFTRMTVFEYQHALRFTYGRLEGVVPPGSYLIYRPKTSFEILDARPRVLTIPGQEVLSADGVSIKVSLLIDVKIVDPKAATLKSSSYEDTLYAKAQTALRNAISQKPIEEVLASRSQLGDSVRAEVEATAQELGLEIGAVAVKDIMFPGSLKEAFSQTARARQESLAALERARGESAALRNLANASRLLDGNPGLFQLRLVQAVGDAGSVVVHLDRDAKK